MARLVGQPWRTDDIADRIDPRLASAQPLVDDDVGPVDGDSGVFEADVFDIANDPDCQDYALGIGLEGTGVVVDRTHVVVDEWLRTSEPGIYAIGDLVGPPWLAHKASHEGVICVERIAGVNDVHPLDLHNIPSCTYCRPQVASVGLTEKAAREAGHEVKIGHFPFIGNGKAIALGEPEGMVKTIFDGETGELLGAHMIGAEVTELIRTIFPHPTLSETMHEAVLDAYGRAIHF